jgi:hypothetical protein
MLHERGRSGLGVKEATMTTTAWNVKEWNGEMAQRARDDDDPQEDQW